MSIQIFGLPVSRGVAIGRAVLVASGRVDVPHHFIDPNKVQEEVARLLSARDTVDDEFEMLKRDLPSDVPTELAALQNAPGKRKVLADAARRMAADMIARLQDQRRFAELANETAGEHFTPREVIRLIVDLLIANDDTKLTGRGIIRQVYDPACGTGGMLESVPELMTLARCGG